MIFLPSWRRRSCPTEVESHLQCKALCYRFDKSLWSEHLHHWKESFATAGQIRFVRAFAWRRRVETQDFVKGDLYAVRYDRISDLLSQKMLELI